MASWLLLCAAPCCAQVSGSVGVVSDYRYRGISLSDGRPALQLNLNRDFDNGAYAGLMLSSVRVGPDGDPALQWLPYAGLVRRYGAARWEGGVQYYGFSRGGRGFADAFVGVGGDRMQARLHHAPRYFGVQPAWYAELDAQRPLQTRWRLLAHAGYVRWHGNGEAPSGHRNDVRLGVGADWGRIDVQLAWTRSCCGRDRAEAYEPGERYGRHGAAPIDGTLGADHAWVLQLLHHW